MFLLFESPKKEKLLKSKPMGKVALGQYMTPANIAAFMASLFTDISDDFQLLDAGAGEGSLSCAFLEALRNGKGNVQHGEVFLLSHFGRVKTPSFSWQLQRFFCKMKHERISSW